MKPSKLLAICQVALCCIMWLMAVAAWAGNSTAIKVPSSDWLVLIAGLITAIYGVISKVAASSTRLPANVRRWIQKLGDANILDIVLKAENLAHMDGAGRRSWAIDELQKLAVDKAGFRLPTSIASLIVEYAYQVYVKLRARK